jgi:uncharacterized membrane protein
MLIMAIDHVRDNFHLGQPEPTDLATTTPILFFTRWITHFCAPTFVFLSGISAYIAGTRRSNVVFSSFLLKRGLWLVVVEIVLVTFAITLDPFYHIIILQVIWAIGGSMILLGILVRLKASPMLIGIIGGIIFFGHNLLDIVNPGSIAGTFLWKILLSAAGFNALTPLGHNYFILVAYALLPWTGVMFTGYAFGTLYTGAVEAAKRRKILLLSGFGLLALFVVLRYFNIYGDPSPWSVQKTGALSIISFFNVSKYPCSLLYLSMTVGTALVILSLAENLNNKFTGIVIVFGNVPFFYYLCHWYLIQLMHITVFFASGYTVAQIADPKIPFLFEPKGFGFNLGGVYIVWLILITILYFPCKWFSAYKKTHRQWWLSYI